MSEGRNWRRQAEDNLLQRMVKEEAEQAAAEAGMPDIEYEQTDPLLIPEDEDEGQDTA